jgi:hypothetical protein
VIETQATHVLKLDDVKSWLAEHGVDIDNAVDVTIRIAQPGTEIAAWADIRFYKLDDRGWRYSEGDEVAVGQVSVPLRSFPTLVPAVEARKKAS